MSLTVTFYGTRGSIPSPGPGTARYGGNTPCLLIASSDGELVLDAGTGIRALGKALAARAPGGGFGVDILLTHTHWDHIQGLPFFQPLFQSGVRVDVFGPRQRATTLGAILDRQMDPTVFPVPLAAAHAKVEVREIATDALTLPHFAVSLFEACHPGPTTGFSVRPRGGGARVIYLTDNELHAITETGRRGDLVRFLRDGDLLVHDATYFESEARERRGWGHSSAAEAAAIAMESGCRRLVLFHHDPEHDDAFMDKIGEHAQKEWAGAVVAKEGMTIEF
jgi:ribonuclease BN (tRNA processing enzyme)